MTNEKKPIETDSEELIEQSRLLEYVNSMDSNRFKEWVDCSWKLKDIDPFLVASFQGLGRLDSRLVIEDAKILQNRPSNPFQDVEPHFTESYLWVLGAYETVRTLSQFADSGNSNRYEAKKEKIRKLKHEFEKVRIPLAKNEAARKNPEGYASPEHITIPGIGIGWLIGPKQPVSRKSLSDSLLSLFKELP
ncbi:MAG: hypothetical protein AAF703_02005 [Cyanobacteria bacterium P01_D01_bin.105]